MIMFGRAFMFSGSSGRYLLLYQEAQRTVFDTILYIARKCGSGTSNSTTNVECMAPSSRADVVKEENGASFAEKGGVGIECLLKIVEYFLRTIGAQCGNRFVPSNNVATGRLLNGGGVGGIASAISSPQLVAAAVSAGAEVTDAEALGLIFALKALQALVDCDGNSSVFRTLLSRYVIC
jgi:hypothetical protein